jgi:hypothetical protein
MRVPLTFRLSLALTFTGAVGLIAGCSSSGSPSTTDGQSDASIGAGDTPTEPASPAAQSSCKLAPASLIKEKLKLDVQAPSEVSADNTVECTYLSGQQGNSVIVRFQAGRDATTFADRRHTADNGGQPTSDIAGVGDQAYQSSVEYGDTVTNTMVARKGAVEIEVVSVGTVDAEKALLVALFSALG